LVLLVNGNDTQSVFKCNLANLSIHNKDDQKRKNESEDCYNKTDIRTRLFLLICELYKRVVEYTVQPTQDYHHNNFGLC
jgi:hypothetical protein